MKQLFLGIILICSLMISPSISFANEGSGESSGVTVKVTEPIPGANCGTEANDDGVYECNIQKGFGSIVAMAGEMIKYFTYIAALGAVLFIVVNGILYSMAGINDSLKTGAKERIIKTLIGLVILMLSGVILNAIAPWIYK